jgi:long-chain-fatty-acid--CoA ligase ACSBG
LAENLVFKDLRATFGLD